MWRIFGIIFLNMYLSQILQIGNKMQKLDSNSLPVAFTFSVLWNILPFYEKLPKWMWLLKLLNSETKKLWEDYEQAFLNWGQNYKSEMNSQDNDIKLFKQRQQFYSHFYLNNDEIILNSSRILEELDDGTLILFNNSNQEVFDTKLHFADETTLQNYIPAVNCPNFKADVQEFHFTNNSFLLSVGRVVRDELLKGSVLVRLLENKRIRLETFISPVIPIDYLNDQDVVSKIERYSQWPMKNWWCKPKFLLTRDFDTWNTYLMYKILKAIKDIREIIVIDPLYWSYKSNLNNLHNLMRFNPYVKITHLEIDMGNPESKSKTITLASPSFLVISNYNATPVKWDSPEVKIEGGAIKLITRNNQSWILFELWRLSSRKLTIHNDTKNFTNVLNDQTFIKLIEDIWCEGGKKCWLLFKLNDVLKYETTTIDSISTLSKSKMLRSIQINVKFGEFELNELIQHFYSIPRHLHLGFRISFENSYPNEEDEIWKFILKIKNIELQSQRSKVFKVIEKIGESNIDDLNESLFKVLIDSEEQEVTFKDLYRLLKDSR